MDTTTAPTTRLFPTADAAAAEGYATFNRAPHLAVDVPDGMTTITVRTSGGRRATFCLIPYSEKGQPDCIDICHHHGDPSKQIKNGDLTLDVQDLRVFGPGTRDPYAYSPQWKSCRDMPKPTLTTLIIEP